jgi:hypothetical protein
MPAMMSWARIFFMMQFLLVESVNAFLNCNDTAKPVPFDHKIH